MPPPSQDQNEMKIKTPLGKDVVLLQGFAMTEELGRLFTINVELASTQNINLEDLLGKNVTISLDLTAGERFFNGHVSGISQGINEGSYARYNATIHPWLWFLTRTSDCRIFQNKTVPEIIKEVCNDSGFTDIKDNLTGNYPAREYIVQYRETDYNFLSRQMEAEGIYYYFSHSDGRHELILADDIVAHELDIGEIPYFPPNETAVREEEYISDWFFRKRIQPGSCVLNDYNPLTPQADLHVDATVARTHSEAEYEVYDDPALFDNRGAGEGYARKRIEEFHAQYEEGMGQGIARELSCGCLFSLANYPREDQNRQYLVVLATHSMHIADFESDRSAESSAAYANDFTVIESSTPYRSPRITPKPFIQGPQTAFVVGPEGEEIYTDEYARVKVQFHWDRLGTHDDNSSCFIRVAEYMAGKKWGSIYIPRIGQEVIVEFLEGDPDRPIIVGAVRNADHPPPYDLPANKTQSGYKSRSTKGGSTANFNEIRMEDKKGEEHLYIHAEKNQNNVVENDEHTSVGNDRTEVVGNDETIDIGNDRTETVAANETITIDGSRTESVGGDESISISGNRHEMVYGDEGVTIGGNRSILVAGTDDTAVTGDQSNSVSSNVAETIAGTYSQTVGGGITISTAGAMNVSAIGGFTVLAPGGTKFIDNTFTWLGGVASEFYGQIVNGTPMKVEGTGMAIETKGLVVEMGTLKTMKFGVGLQKMGAKLMTTDSAKLDKAGLILAKAGLHLIS